MMAKDEAYPAQSQAFIAILSGLNRLNYLMRRFGGRRISWGKTRHKREGGDLKGKYVALDSAVDDQQETCPKGSLLERIAFLEERLVQMCLEIESCRRSLPCSSSINVSSGSGASSSSNNINNNAESRIERMSSYPTFSYKPQTKQLPQSSNYNPFDSETDQTQNLKGSMKKKEAAGNKKEKKSGMKRKKSISPNWLPLNILGC